MSVIDGTIPFPTPVVLGHEGAGIVTELGPDVTGLNVGDHVVISTLSNCGACAACDSGKPTHCRESIGKMSAPFRQGDRKVLQFANIGAFTQETIVKARQAVPISKEVPWEVASLLGCGVITGVGAVFNRAKVTHGQSVLVLGVGGIGLNVIQGAALADALPIIAIDTNPKKEALAKQFGATHFIDCVTGRRQRGGQGDLSQRCRRLLRVRRPSRADPTGDRPARLGRHVCDPRRAEVRYRGRLPGEPRSTTTRRSWGVATGPGRPHKDIPLFVDLYLAGRLKLDELVTRTYPLDDIQQTIDDMHHGDLARGVLKL